MGQLLMFLHVGAAIVAFCPTFAFPILGAIGGKEPMFANFATRASEAIEKKLVLPFALSMPVSGIGLIWFADVDLLSTRSAWLSVGIVVYTAAILFVLRVQGPAVEQVGGRARLWCSYERGRNLGSAHGAAIAHPRGP